MDFLQPTSLADAIEAKAQRPGAVPVAGGTDVMVEINFDVRRPEALLDLNRVPELTSWDQAGGRVRLGAGLTYARIIGEVGGLLPGLALAARTVGSPQIRNRGTIGTRNAMVIAVCAFALDLRPPGSGGPGSVTGTVGTGIGSAGPTPLRAVDAEEFLAGALADSGRWESAAPLPDPVVRRFGELVAQAARPIDDVRGTAAYRRHALSVLARRTLGWAWESWRTEKQGASCG